MPKGFNTVKQGGEVFEVKYRDDAMDLRLRGIINKRASPKDIFPLNDALKKHQAQVAEPFKSFI